MRKLFTFLRSLAVLVLFVGVVKDGIVNFGKNIELPDTKMIPDTLIQKSFITIPSHDF